MTKIFRNILDIENEVYALIKLLLKDVLQPQQSKIKEL